MIIYLVRHGDRVRQKGDASLTLLGKVQAQKTGEYFKNKGIDVIITSPQKRAKQTASIINKSLRVPLEVDEKLKERINFGDVKNQSYLEFLKMAEYSSLNRFYVLVNGDSSIKCGKRMEKFIKKISSKNYKKVVLVTHGGIITDYLRNVFSKSTLNLIYADFSIKRESVMENCSITRIEVVSGKVKLLEIASVSHLM